MATSSDIENTVNDSEKGRNYNCTRLFVRLLLSPTIGWRNLRNAKVSPSDFEQQTFYPLLAIAAVCRFLILIYQPTTPISIILQQAIVAFVAVFAGYFAALALAKVVLPPVASKKSSSGFFRVFIAASMATLDVGYIISIIAPQTRIILWLGLIYTLYVVCRGVKYLHVPPNERLATSVLSCVLICGVPAAIFAVFTWMLPPV